MVKKSESPIISVLMQLAELEARFASEVHTPVTQASASGQELFCSQLRTSTLTSFEYAPSDKAAKHTAFSLLSM